MSREYQPEMYINANQPVLSDIVLKLPKQKTLYIVYKTMGLNEKNWGSRNRGSNLLVGSQAGLFGMLAKDGQDTSDDVPYSVVGVVQLQNDSRTSGNEVHIFLGTRPLWIERKSGRESNTIPAKVV